jgi:hypothetical protein
MMTTTLKNFVILGAGRAAIALPALAGAQSLRHDYLDAQAARKDIRRLQADRARAVRYHNWGKVAQDDRLIGQDRYWIYKDRGRIQNARMGG